MSARWLNALRVSVPWLIGLAFVVVEVRRVSGQIAVRYPDFSTWAERAASFDIGSLAQWEWVNGLYPLGYPLLLRLGVELGGDVLRTAFAISILGGSVAVALVVTPRSAISWMCTSIRLPAVLLGLVYP